MWPGNKAYAGRDSKHRVTPLTSSVALGAFAFLGTMTSCLLSYGCWTLSNWQSYQSGIQTEPRRQIEIQPYLDMQAIKARQTLLHIKHGGDIQRSILSGDISQSDGRDFHSLGISLVNKEQVLASTHRRGDLKSLESSLTSVHRCRRHGPESTRPPVR